MIRVGAQRRKRRKDERMFCGSFRGEDADRWSGWRLTGRRSRPSAVDGRLRDSARSPYVYREVRLWR